MRAPRLKLLVACLSALLAMGANDAPAFNVQLRQVHGLEQGRFTAAFIEANGEKFSVVVPYDWRVDNNTAQSSLSLSARSGGSPITIQFSTQPSKPVLASAAALRRAALPSLTEASVVEEFPAYSGYGPGRGLDLSFLLQGRPMKSRAVVIPLGEGYASLVSAWALEDEEAVLHTFGTTLTSFHALTAQEIEAASIIEHVTTEKRAHAIAVLAEPTQIVPVLHTDPIPELPPPPPEPPPFFKVHSDGLMLSGSALLLIVLASWTLGRHRREAEIRALVGGYLSDGTEVARFKMPEWFAPMPATRPTPELSKDFVAEGENKMQKKTPTEEFLLDAPALLAAIRLALRDLGRAGNEEQWRAALAALPQHITALKDRANFWEMRPVWQMSSALELLARRIAEKPKDATPSTLRTIGAAADLLQTLCAPDIRPNLIIDPPIRVLAVDDDALCLRALVFALQKVNLDPDTAENGARALALATECPYDVIFMDIQMPEMDGLTACTRIHETETNSDTPVVFVTIQSDFHTRAQSTIKGGSDLMAKPFLVFELAVKALSATMRKRLQLQRSADVSSTAPTPENTLASRAAIASALTKEKAGSMVVETPATTTATTATAAPATPAATKDASDASQDASSLSVEARQFLSDAPDFLAGMRSVLIYVKAAPSEELRKESLGDLYLRIHAFGTQSNVAGLPIAVRVCQSFEALLKKLYEKPAQATASTLHTVAVTIDLLEQLCAPNARHTLSERPPVRLLVVDDEPLARRAVTGALQLAFEKPDETDNAARALEMAQQIPYDVIFTDVNMPDMDGFTFCSQLRATETHAKTPVVFITGQGDDQAREKAVQAGGSDFLAKPCLPCEITLKALTFVLRKRLQLDKPLQSESAPGAAQPPERPTTQRPAVNQPRMDAVSRERQHRKTSRRFKHSEDKQKRKSYLTLD